MEREREGVGIGREDIEGRKVLKTRNSSATRDESMYILVQCFHDYPIVEVVINFHITLIVNFHYLLKNERLK